METAGRRDRCRLARGLWPDLAAVDEPVAAQQRARPSDRPNIVLISLDTTRADHLSVYGYTRRTTPRLEAFAARATRYRRAYANGDMTLSTHASLSTGLYPTLHGAYLDNEQRWAIAATVPTLAELLRKAGYRNYGAVANPGFLDPVYGFARGFDSGGSLARSLSWRRLEGRISSAGASTKLRCPGSGPRPCARSHGPAKSRLRARP